MRLDGNRGVLSDYFGKFRFDVRIIADCHVNGCFYIVAFNVFALCGEAVVCSLRGCTFAYGHRCTERVLVIAAGCIEDSCFFGSHGLLGRICRQLFYLTFQITVFDEETFHFSRCFGYAGISYTVTGEYLSLGKCLFKSFILALNPPLPKVQNGTIFLPAKSMFFTKEVIGKA